MKKLMISVAIAMAAFSVQANAATVTTKGAYQYDVNQLGDASVLNYNIQVCSHNGIKPDVQEKLAKVMGVPEANVRFEFCRRLLTAYGKGAISYEDYVQFVKNHVASPSIAKALGTRVRKH